MKRRTLTISDAADAVLVNYQKAKGIRYISDAADALLLEFGRVDPGPEPEPEPTKYDVEISQAGDSILVRSGIRELARSKVKGDVAILFKTAIDAVKPGGSLGIGPGTYELSAPHSFGLNADGSNIFCSSIQILDKSMHIHGAGAGKTVLRLMPWQRSSTRHVAMMLIRGTGPMGAGYSSFTLEGITFDGNCGQQFLSALPEDGEALVLVGSDRRNGRYENLEFRNSFATGLYLGNNGSGSGTSELVQNVVARDCKATGIMLDTCRESKVLDCSAWNCRDGLQLYGNDDWAKRGPDRVTVERFQTDSQVICWQVNDFSLSEIKMDCTKAAKPYGLAVRDGSGAVKNSILKNSKARRDSTGGATYIYEAAQVRLEDCQLSGWFGIHAIGSSQVEAIGCRLEAPGGCYCTTDKAPVSSTIRAENCTWAGKKSDLGEGSRLDEDWGQGLSAW